MPKNQQIYPQLPPGSVYFSQMHSLRWKGLKPKQCMSLLYNEIMAHAAVYNTLVVTDSHAIQNWWLKSMLENQSDFPGMEELFKKGIIRVAKRKGSSLIETAHNQIDNVPVLYTSKQAKLDSTYLKHAEKIEDLTCRFNS